MSIARRGMGARYLLAAIGGLAAMVAGAQGHYQPDAQTGKKRKGSGSRKGLGFISPRFGKSKGKTYPFSSTRQGARCADRQVTQAVNGFPLMQTLPRK